MKRLILILMAAAATDAVAKMDLVTVPKRDKVQITIYNSADLTLVRETRALTLRKGVNKLQFSWANTLIDPTSLSMRPLKNGDKIDVDSLVFPPRVKGLGLWKVTSEIAGDVPFEITYFTSGIGWRASYMATLSPDEKTMELQGYVRVQNRSGEEYAKAQTRLIVGKINLLEQIRSLAQRRYAFDKPGRFVRPPADEGGFNDDDNDFGDNDFGDNGKKPGEGKGGGRGPKAIKRQGLSEYFLYTIEGTETIPNQWAKRLPSFTTKKIPVVNLYKYDPDMYGNEQVRRFLSFKNDKDHKLGQTPIPGGQLRAFRTTDAKQHLAYIGASSFKYIPVKEDVELDLGAVRNVIVDGKQMKLEKEKYLFDGRGNINGWDVVRTNQTTVKNTRNLPARVQITWNMGDQYWDLKHDLKPAEYEKVDLKTVRFTVELPARSKKVFTTTIREYYGKRREIKDANQ